MTALGFLASIVLFVGGILMMGNAWLVPDIEAVVFVGGILAISASLAICFHVMPRTR